MKKSRNISSNSSFVSIRKAPRANVLSDTNEQEKANKTSALDVESLRAMGRIVRAIKNRIAEAARGKLCN